MVLSDEKKRDYVKRLMLARMKLLCDQGFYGLLLMNMTFTLDESCQTVAADGKRIFFNPKFLDALSDSQLEFTLMHEILHIVLQHSHRNEDRDEELFDRACDIVVNSTILQSGNFKEEDLHIKGFGDAEHFLPDGSEGRYYTAEEVYAKLLALPPGQISKTAAVGKAKGKGAKQKGGSSGSKSVSTAETGNASQTGHESEGKDKASKADKTSYGWDDHSRWDTYEEDDSLKDSWTRHLQEAGAAMEAREAINGLRGRGLIPLCADRLLKQLRNPQIDWRKILNEFVQEEVCDYSFNPPDRRFDDSPFFLPDFNGTEFRTKDILFMIDASGSMSNRMISDAFSEVRGALEQFNGALEGWLGFFDAVVVEPKPFSSIEELDIIRPKGGGGTDFQIIFEYVEKEMGDDRPACIIILTDGYAPFPEEKMALGIPVLWLINNEQVTPPWGRIARISAV